jgi:hypothetical protein
MSHHLSCPVCRSQIPIDLRLLAQGGAFRCPSTTCQAVIGLDRGSLATFSGALSRYERLEMLRATPGGGARPPDGQPGDAP